MILQYRQNTEKKKRGRAGTGQAGRQCKDLEVGTNLYVRRPEERDRPG